MMYEKLLDGCTGYVQLLVYRMTEWQILSQIDLFSFFLVHSLSTMPIFSSVCLINICLLDFTLLYRMCCLTMYQKQEPVYGRCDTLRKVEGEGQAL